LQSTRKSSALTVDVALVVLEGVPVEVVAGSLVAVLAVEVPLLELPPAALAV
jgi:hypothetical protein